MKTRIDKQGWTIHEDGTESRGAGLADCLACGAAIVHNTRPNRVPDFCDDRCEANYYGEDDEMDEI